MLPIIEEPALRRVISPKVAVETIRDALRADGDGRTHVPSVIHLDVPAAHGEFHVKTARIDGVPYIAVKIATGFYDNPAKGLPSGSGLMVLFDAATGRPSALLLDNGFLTDMRTGAAGAIAADVLARRSVRAVGILGSGIQARVQMLCLREVRDIPKILVWSPNRTHVDAYIGDMRAAGFAVESRPTPEAVCREADIVVTATPSREPLVRAEWLRAGQHITAVGSDAPGKQELEPACLTRADVVVVDRLTQCAAFGELRHAMEASLLRASGVQGELGEIVAGMKRGRTRDDQITIADLTGVGFQDTAIAARALQLVNA